MTAVILAAGRGGRLKGLFGDLPKCLAPIGGRTLLSRQVDALRGAGVHSIVVVAGFGIEHVRRAVPLGVEVVENADWAQTNSLYSLWLVRDRLEGGALILNSDVLFHPTLLRSLLEARVDDALLVGLRRDGPAYGSEEMKVVVRRGLVTCISKHVAPDDADGENVGISRFSAAGAIHLAAHLDDLVTRQGATRDWLPRAFQAFVRQRPLHAIDTGGWPWTEIDFPDDYWRACREVLPAIEGRPLSEMPPDDVQGERAMHHV